jgi:hypothetical protein
MVTGLAGASIKKFDNGPGQHRDKPEKKRLKTNTPRTTELSSIVL